MAVNNRANDSLDLSLLKSYEAGSALAIDAASYAESTKLSDTACTYPPFGLKVLQAVAQAGASFPQRFVVLGSTYFLPPPKGCASSTGSCPNGDSLLEFERSTSSGAWKIVLEPSADSGDIVQLTADGSRAASLSASAAAAARGLPQALAGDLVTYEKTGSRGPLQAGYFTGSCWLIGNPRNAAEEYERSGVNASQAYSPAADQVSVPITGGDALTMFTLDFETTLVPTAADATIDWVANPALGPATELLAPGQYRRVVEHGALQVAAETGTEVSE